MVRNVDGGPSSDTAQRLFTPIAPTYERWARLLSLGQDPRWRAALVSSMPLGDHATVLDVAAGTGSITRLLIARGWTVVSLDVTEAMLRQAAGTTMPVLASAARLPFADATFDGLTFGYLLRYVPDVGVCMGELARVVRPGGWVGMVEFARPDGFWRAPWKVYTGAVLPAAGAMVGSGWGEVGRFLGASIDGFARRHPPGALAEVWERAGLDDVRWRRMSLGGGMAMWGRRT